MPTDTDTRHESVSQGWPFKRVCEMLVRLNPDRSRSGIESRIKQWQRLGVPAGVNVGRGLRVTYGREQVLAMIFMNELTRLGFPAATAKAIIEGKDLLEMEYLGAFQFLPDPLSRGLVTLNGRRFRLALDMLNAEDVS